MRLIEFPFPPKAESDLGTPLTFVVATGEEVTRSEDTEKDYALCRRIAHASRTPLHSNERQGEPYRRYAKRERLCSGQV
jgi:hypothetical protein